MISPSQWKEITELLASVGDPLGFAQGEGLRESLSHYLDILLAKNEEVNLTAIREYDAAVWKHIADSLILSQWESLGVVADWGSGGGLPGIPLALARRSVGNTTPVFFLDSVGKKLRAVEEFATTLEIQGSKFFNARGEDLIKKGMLRSVETVVMRAVAPPEEVIRWLDKSIKRWVLLLGPQQRDLWLQQGALIGRKGFVFGRKSEFSLPQNHGERALLELIRK